MAVGLALGWLAAQLIARVDDRLISSTLTTLLAYGAYLPADTSIPGAAWTIGLADTSAAMLAGMLIFPIVFASGLDPAEGPGLIFVIYKGKRYMA